MYPEAKAKPKVKEMVEGGETDVDVIFDKLKEEMLLVKKDTIAAWVEEFGGESAQEEEKEEEGGGVSEEASRIDRKREEAAQRYLLSQGKRLDPQTFIVELQKLKAMTDDEIERTVTGKKPSILETEIQSPLIRATVSKPLSGEEEGLGLVFSVVGRVIEETETIEATAEPLKALLARYEKEGAPWMIGGSNEEEAWDGFEFIRPHDPRYLNSVIEALGWKGYRFREGV